MEANIIKNCRQNIGLFSECSCDMFGLDFVLESEDVQIINSLLEQANVYQRAAESYE